MVECIYCKWYLICSSQRRGSWHQNDRSWTSCGCKSWSTRRFLCRCQCDKWRLAISKNVSKHEITVSLYRAKLNTMKDIVSKALTDNKISHEEFILIKSEVDKYHEMKKSISQK